MSEDHDDGGPEMPPEEIVLPIEEHIDLHFFRPKEIPAVIESYLEEARAAGFTEVRLIHGRGIGVQRSITRKLLERHPAVEAFADAPAERGGWGATLVRLAALGSTDEPTELECDPGPDDTGDR